MTDGVGTRSRTGGGWVLLIGAVIAVLAVSVIVIGVLASSDRVAIAELEIGDCFDLPEPSDDDVQTIETVEQISCPDPHLAEVVGAGELGGADEPYPLERELFDEVDRRCRAAQLDVDETAFGLLPVIPTEARWAQDDRGYLCVAIPYGGGLVTGSATGG